MSGKDLEIKLEIEKILQGDSVGQNLKTYFENMPDKNIRRSIFVLSNIYPDRLNIPDDDLVFITHLFSNKKFIGQENYFEFIRSINIIDFTENQKNILINIIKEHIETLCKNCIFELDFLLIKLFEPHELVKYIEMLAKDGSPAVLQHISDILRYEDFSDSDIADEAIEILKQEVSRKLSQA